MTEVSSAGHRGLKFWAALSAVSMVSVLSAIDQTVVATALPHIMDSLRGASILGWVFTAYFLGATATVAVTGKLTDQFGRRRMFFLAVLVFLAGSLLCGVATSMPMLVAFRGLQGIGAGSIQTCSLIVMGDMFSPRERGKWQVINSIGFATGSAIGPSIGGLLSDHTSWRWIFLLNGPVCALTLVALLYGLVDVYRPATRPKIDWTGGAWSMVVVITLLLGLTWGGREYAWTSPEIIALAAVTLVAGVLLYRTEQRAVDPVIPGSLLRGNVPLLSTIAGFANNMVWFGLILLIPLRLQLVLGASATVAGALLTPAIVLAPSCSIVAGQMLSRTGRYRLPGLISGIFQVAGVSMLLFNPPGIGELWVTLSFIVAGVGCGFGGPTFMITFQNGIPHRQLGAGMGLLSLFRQFGSSIGTAMVGSIAGAGAVQASAPALAAAVHQAFIFELGAALLVLVTVWFTANQPLRTNIHETEDGGLPVASMLATVEAI